MMCCCSAGVLQLVVMLLCFVCCPLLGQLRTFMADWTPPTMTLRRLGEGKTADPLHMEIRRRDQANEPLLPLSLSRICLGNDSHRLKGMVS